MARFLLFSLLAVGLFCLTLAIGCGGDVSPSSSANNNGPTAGNGSGTGGGTPSGGSGSGGSSSGGGGGSASVNNDTVWQVSLMGWNDQQVHGQVTVDADGHTGNGSYNFSGATANSSYTFRFCMGFASASDCFDIQTGTADASGAGSGKFHFVPPSRWGAVHEEYEGVFLVDIAGQRWAVTSWTGSDATSSYSAQIYRTNSSDPTAASATPGRVTVKGDQVHVHVVGAKPSTTYEVGQQDTINSHGGHSLGMLTTDASGNADADFHSDQAGWDIDIGLPSGSTTTDSYAGAFGLK